MANDSRARNFGGTAVLFAMIAGVAALLLALASGVAAHFEAAALSLLAAGVSFGAVANAIFRD
jgi:hypothetical protein